MICFTIIPPPPVTHSEEAVTTEGEMCILITLYMFIHFLDLINEFSPTAPPTGVEIGMLPPNSDYSISGTLFILDTKTLLIEDFNYDGNAPGESITLIVYLNAYELVRCHVNCRCLSLLLPSWSGYRQERWRFFHTSTRWKVSHTHIHYLHSISVEHRSCIRIVALPSYTISVHMQ